MPVRLTEPVPLVLLVRVLALATTLALLAAPSAFALSAHVFSSSVASAGAGAGALDPFGMSRSLALPAALPASFGSEGSGAGQLSNPRGIAVDQETGDVWVADRENNRIDKFGPEGTFLFAVGYGVGDGKTEALQKCTTTCFAGLAGTNAGQFMSAEGIAVDNEPASPSRHDVYVADTSNARVEKFNAEGEFLLMFGGEVDQTRKLDVCTKADLQASDVCGAGAEGEAAGAFKGLTKHAVAVDPTSATVYVADDDRVQRFSEAGVALSAVAFPLAGEGQNLAVDSAQDIYLKSSELRGVRKYDATGKELGKPRDELGPGPSKTVAIGPANELFVNHLQGESHHLFAFNPEGEQIASFDAQGEPLNGSRGIAYSEHSEALYVLNLATSEGAVRIVFPPMPGPLILAGSESAGEIQPTRASLAATINPEGAKPTTYHFEYGVTETYGHSTTQTPLTEGEFEDQATSAAVTELQPSTIYHFRAVATNGTQTTDGPDRTFTTLPPVSIDSTFVTEVDNESASLQAELNPHGIPSEYHFEYDTTPYLESEPGHGTKLPTPDAPVAPEATDVTVSDTLQKLSPATVYHYRVVAHNELGEVRGHDHTFTTQGPIVPLPDGRQWELVSPANKHGAPLEPITKEGGLIQASAGGGAFTYVAIGPLGQESEGARSPEDAQLLSRRDPTTGWSTQDISTPHEELTEIKPSFLSEYKFFGEDLSAGIVEPKGATPLSPDTTERTPYRRESSGEFVPLVSSANVPPGTKFGGEELPPSGEWANGVVFQAATANMSHVLLSSTHLLAAGFSEGFAPTEASLYELTGGKLTLVSFLPDGKPAAEQGLAAAVGDEGRNVRGAISGDGNDVVFSTPGALFMRDLSATTTIQLDQAESGASGTSGGGVFQAASSDGSRVLFTDASRLTVGSTATAEQPDLYMCSITASVGGPSCTLTDVTVDHHPGESANVQRLVSAVDQTASHVYFIAEGVLTDAPNPQGESAVPGQPNMYEYDVAAKATHLVAVLSNNDRGTLGPLASAVEMRNLVDRSSPDGRFFTFMSQRSLTGYDNRDAVSGHPDEEVFLFDAADGSLRCVSCNPTGARPHGVLDPIVTNQSRELLVDEPETWPNTWLAGSIPGWTAIDIDRGLYQSRYLSDSGRIFFNSPDSLVPQDRNKVEDVYQWEPVSVGSCTEASSAYSPRSGGCVSLISSGTSNEESAFLDASENGDEVFFLTAARLTADDGDTAYDVYDAHVCSESSPCPPLPSSTPGCEGDSCQNPSAPPTPGTPASLSYHGPGNASPSTPAMPKPKPLTKEQLLTRALKACRTKHSRHARVPCERQARRRYGARKTSKAKRAALHSHSRGGRAVGS